MPNNFRDLAPYTIRCLSCGKEVTKSLSWFMENLRTTCPHCGDIIDLDGDELRSSLNQLADICDQLSIHFK